MKHKAAAIGLTIGLLAGGTAGLAIGVPALSGAQETTTTAPTEDTDRPDPGQHLREALQPLVDDGTLTQEQADAVIAALEAARPEGGPGGHHEGMGRHGPGLDAAASALGITEDELRTELQNGQTIAGVAQSKGIDPQTVVDALVADLKAHLDEEVASGEHTQAEADQKLADATQRITDMVNGQMPAGPPDGGRGPRGGDIPSS